MAQHYFSNKKYTADDILFFLGLIMILPLFFLFLANSHGSFSLTHLVPPCLFHFVTGLPCPGCGGTRAFVSLLRGDLVQSFLYHPVVPFCFLLYVIFMLTQTISRIFQKTTRFRFRALSFRLEYVYVAVLLIFVQWIIKLIAAIV